MSVTLIPDIIAVIANKIKSNDTNCWNTDL